MEHPSLNNDTVTRMLKTREFDRKSLVQLGKFLAVGMMNTVIGYSIFALLTVLDFGPSTALVLTYVIAVPVNYFTTGKIVFDITNFKSFLHFIITYVAIYGVNLGALNLLMQLELGQLLAQAIIVPFIAILSFMIFRNFVFRN